MAITIEATYANGVLKPAGPLPLNENQRIILTIHETGPGPKPGYGLLPWTGSLADLNYLIEDVENDPLEEDKRDSLTQLMNQPPLTLMVWPVM